VKLLGDAGVGSRHRSLEAVAQALRIHRWARARAVAEELERAGWTPSPRCEGRWDDPMGKHRDCPPWRALEIARRDAAP
jgi:hypothetical protein